MYIHRSNNPANLAKIGSGSLDFDVIGLTEFVDKNGYKNKKQKQNTSHSQQPTSIYRIGFQKLST